MDKKYYTVNEVIKHFKSTRRSIDFEDICGYVRKRIIHPVVYIDSVPAHAYETVNVDQTLAIGFCYLSAYWHIDEDKIIALCDNLLRGQLVTTRGVNKEELTQIRITSWMTESYDFDGVPAKHIRPKQYSNDLVITGFMFPPQSLFSIHVGNIALSEEELNILISFSASTDETELDYKNKRESSISTNDTPLTLKGKNEFFQTGDVFTIVYKGAKPIHLKASIGLKQLEYMVKNPNKSFSAIALMQQFNLLSAEIIFSDENRFELAEQGIYEDEFHHSINDQMTDQKAIDDCKQRLSEIDEDIINAQEVNDIEAIEKLKDEKDNILKYMRKATNHIHQPRMSKNTSTKASDALKKNITCALKKIEAELPELNNHLLKCLKMGKDCVYIAPDDHIWT